jgi:hypothetical protein
MHTDALFYVSFHATKEISDLKELEFLVWI